VNTKNQYLINNIKFAHNLHYFIIKFYWHSHNTHSKIYMKSIWGSFKNDVWSGSDMVWSLFEIKIWKYPNPLFRNLEKFLPTPLIDIISKWPPNCQKNKKNPLSLCLFFSSILSFIPLTPNSVLRQNTGQWSKTHLTAI